jgi:hypothetical protein
MSPLSLDAPRNDQADQNHIAPHTDAAAAVAAAARLPNRELIQTVDTTPREQRTDHGVA